MACAMVGASRACLSGPVFSNAVRGGSKLRAALPHRLSLCTKAMASPDYSKLQTVGPRFNVYVKGFPRENLLGDCPFCHRLMLVLEEKSIPYFRTYVNEYDMPSWIEDVNPKGAQIPIALDLQTNKWHYDSDMIVPFLEDEFPEPKLGKPDKCTQVGNGLFPAFIEFLKSEGEAETKEKEKGLVKELTDINTHLDKNGPFLAGDHICVACLTQAPRLKHVKIATKAIKNWDGFSKFGAINTFMDKMGQRQSWKNTFYSDDIVISGWKKKLEMMKSS